VERGVAGGGGEEERRGEHLEPRSCGSHEGIVDPDRLKARPVIFMAMIVLPISLPSVTRSAANTRTSLAGIAAPMAAAQQASKSRTKCPMKTRMKEWSTRRPKARA